MKWSENGGGEMEGGRREKARERCKQGDIGKQGRRAAFESSAKSAFQPSILPRARGFLEPPRAFENGSRKHLAARSRARAPATNPKPSSLAPRLVTYFCFPAPLFSSTIVVRRISDSFFEKNGMEWSGRREKNKITRLILEELGRGGGGRSSLRRDEKSFSAGGEEAQEEAKATGN